jgi:hypothetical protein
MLLRSISCLISVESKQVARFQFWVVRHLLI